MTRVLLILVLATTTTPLQCRLLMPNCAFSFMFSVRDRLVTLRPRSSPDDVVFSMPRTPFCTGTTVRAPWLCVDPVELFVELFLMTNSLAFLWPAVE